MKRREDKLYNRDFPWYSSTELTKLYPDKNELRIALFKLFYLPAATYSIKDNKIIAGIEGAKIDLSQAYDEYKKLSVYIQMERLEDGMKILECFIKDG